MSTEPGRKLLVIDDDSLVRQSIVAYLDDCGYRVHAEADGQAGLAWFESHRPDLVLTDLRMPESNGLSVLQAIKKVDTDIPVIVISGVGMVSDVVQALRLGAADYLMKPLVDIGVLIHSIRRALEVLDLQRENKRYRHELETANRELSEYVHVLERDQRAGRQIQLNLLPTTPATFGNVTIAHKIVPSLYLSGDFVDYGLISNRYLCFYLTDVSGHGASSAFVTVWLKQLVRRLFSEKSVARCGAEFEVDAARLMEVINNEVVRSKFGCHLTCFVGILDLHTRQMRYVLGGHLPLPVLSTAEGTRYLQGKGKPLGIFKDAKWEVFQADLPEAFSLTVFSDGVLEILPEKDLIAKEAYLLDLVAQAKGHMQTVAARLRLEDAVEAPDDIAVLTLTSGDIK